MRANPYPHAVLHSGVQTGCTAHKLAILLQQFYESEIACKDNAGPWPCV